MKALLQLFIAALLAAFLEPCLMAQQRPLERLNSEAFGVISPPDVLCSEKPLSS
jgi:hypothetical protein